MFPLGIDLCSSFVTSDAVLLPVDCALIIFLAEVNQHGYTQESVSQEGFSEEGLSKEEGLSQEGLSQEEGATQDQGKEVAKEGRREARTYSLHQLLLGAASPCEEGKSCTVVR